jgi:hypothetical protein
MYPITGIVGCCARAAIGQAVAATPEQRDEIAPPHVGPPPPESVYRTFSLPQGSRRVLWGDLNCSE